MVMASPVPHWRRNCGNYAASSPTRVAETFTQTRAMIACCESRAALPNLGSRNPLFSLNELKPCLLIQVTYRYGHPFAAAAAPQMRTRISPSETLAVKASRNRNRDFSQ